MTPLHARGQFIRLAETGCPFKTTIRWQMADEPTRHNGGRTEVSFQRMLNNHASAKGLTSNALWQYLVLPQFNRPKQNEIIALRSAESYFDLHPGLCKLFFKFLCECVMS